MSGLLRDSRFTSQKASWDMEFALRPWADIVDDDDLEPLEAMNNGTVVKPAISYFSTQIDPN